MPARPPTSNGPSTIPTRDPSHASTRLTKSNHHGPSLLRTVNGRARYPLPPSDAPTQKSYSAEQAMTEDDINKPPRDSSDEEGEDHAKIEPLAKTDNPPPPPSKRPSGGLRDPRRSKRPRLQHEPDPPNDPPQEKPERNAIAGSSAQSTEGDIFGSMNAPRTSQKFRSYGKPKDTGAKRDAPQFKAPKPMLEKPTGIAQNSATRALTDKLPEEGPVRLRNAFKDYNVTRHDLRPLDSGGSSQNASLSNSFNSSAQSERPERNGSSPPSTPTSQRKDWEMSDSPTTAFTTNICPVCQKEVIRSRLNDPDVNIQEVYFFPLRKQQAFCHEHTLADARVLFAEREFPEINWFRLKTQRIPRHTKVLKDIIYRRIPSFFLEEIDLQIPDKTNRKQIQKYLERQRKEATLAPTGYYGAKGAQIMAEVIAQDLSSFMSGRAAHELVKCIGVGPFIASVLVPELTQRLVMEDMDVGDAAKARTIMHESAFAGMILHPEDEKVERRDDD